MSNWERYQNWLVLNLLPDIGRSRFNALVRHFGSPDRVLQASPADLAEVNGIGPMAVESIRNWRALADVETELRMVEDNGVSLVCLDDEEYPANLRTMGAPPPLLYYRGSLCAMDEAAVAVIGSRKMSRYGREVTEIVAADLAKAGVTVVSGLALGVDSAAHQAALDAGGRTLAVLGNGLCHVYPTQHRELAKDVMENGALISEMPMRAAPDAGSFPQRNAIIAGLSLGVAVMEAGLKSGTQITVSQAAEENRAVYAVPGDITRVNSMGTNQLIKEGVRLITGARDILVDLEPQLRCLLAGLPSEGDGVPEAPRPLPKDLNATEAVIYEALELDPLSIDALLESLEQELAMGELMSALLSLELRGLVRQEPGMRFRRAR